VCHATSKPDAGAPPQVMVNGRLTAARRCFSRRDRGRAVRGLPHLMGRERATLAALADDSSRLEEPRWPGRHR
jgi:hypothetical protein